MTRKNYTNRRHSNRGGGRGGRRKPRSLLKTLLLTSAMIVVPTAAIGTAVYFALGEIGKETLSRVSYCYENRQDQYQLAVWVDFTVTFGSSGSQKNDLQNVLEQEYGQMSPNSKMSVFTTARDGAATIVKPAFTICRPPRNAGEQQQIDAPQKSDAMLRRDSKNAEQAFLDHVAELSRDAEDKAKTAVNSPVLAQLRGISRYNFGAPLSKLVVYSDGLNNDRYGSFCTVSGHLPGFDIYAKKSEYQRIKPNDLTGVDVEFLLLDAGNLPYCKPGELAEWYQNYFSSNGAIDARITPIGVGAG